MRKYRHKCKENAEKNNELLEKDRKRKAASKENATPQQLTLLRDRTKKAVQKHRSKHTVLVECETSENANANSTYSRTSSLTRAVSKTMDSLPQCAVKRQLVLKNLMEKHPNVKTCSSKPIETDLSKAVKEFYMQDDITYQVHFF